MSKSRTTQEADNKMIPDLKPGAGCPFNIGDQLNAVVRNRLLRVGEALLLATPDSVKPFLLDNYKKLPKPQISAGYRPVNFQFPWPYCTCEEGSH